MKLTKVQRAYLAGLFDGEGSVGINWNVETLSDLRVRHYPYLRVRLSLCDKATIEYIHKITAMGYVFIKKRYGMGKVKPWQDSYEWVICSRQACAFLNAIARYCITKAQHIKVAQQYQKVRYGRWKEKAKFIRQLYELNSHRTTVAYKYIDELEHYEHRFKPDGTIISKAK